MDTGIVCCYGNLGAIRCPKRGKPFFGQDGRYIGNQPAYRDNGDGTDLNTGLMRQKTPDYVKRSWEEDGALAVVDIDTLWQHKQTREHSHWKGRVGKIYTKMANGEWKLIAHTGAFEYSPKNGL